LGAFSDYHYKYDTRSTAPSSYQTVQCMRCGYTTSYPTGVYEARCMRCGDRCSGATDPRVYKMMEEMLYRIRDIEGAVNFKKRRKADMSSLAAKLRNLARPEDERLLIKHGVIDEKGEVADADLVDQYTFVLVKERIVEDLKKLEAEEKASKSK
jgi:hypothetical protein